MIDFKNYKRVTERFETGRATYACSFRWEPENEQDLLDRLAELEDMIEQGKLIEQIEPKTAKERVEFELKELREKTKKLDDFMQTIKFKELSNKQKDLIYSQLHTMFMYIEILKQRLKNWEE